MMSHIVITGNFDFRSPSANSLRVCGIARALRLAGAEVTIVDNAPDLQTPSFSESMIELGVRLITVNEYGGVQGSVLPRGVRGFFIGDASVRAARATCQGADAIIVYGPHPGYILRFRQLSREMGIPLVLDIVEWYEPEDLPGGKFGPFALANEYSMRHLTTKADGIIAISRRLEAHYQALGCRTLRIPPLFECASAPAEKFSATDGRLHLCYAGTIGRKEAFSLILQRLQRAHERGIDFVFHVIGPSLAEIRAHAEAAGCSQWASDTDRLKSYGRVANLQARQIIAASDFSLLFRPPRKANQFGFPSKLAESMSLGTPVLANSFSDLQEVMIGSAEVLLAPSLSAESIDTLIERARRCTIEEKITISRATLHRARDIFSPQVHATALSEFLN